MNLYQVGHKHPIAPTMMWHYLKDGAELEVVFTEGIEVTLHVILPESDPGYPDTKTYNFIADREMKVSELRKRAWRLMRSGPGGKVPLDLSYVFWDDIHINGEKTDLEWADDHPLEYNVVGLGRAPELEVWVACG